MLCVGLLTACASAPPPPVAIPPRPARESIQRFGLSGRAIIRQSARADTMRLTWEHSVAEDAIGFSSSLGMVVAELQRNASGARWMTADGERFEARSADQLMARITDQPVPLEALSRWVVGRVGNGATATRDAKGRLLEAVDQGWSVRVLSYETELPEALPSTIEVEHGALRIRLAIEEWVL
ncbi:outer membrane lipoprotein LolB [Uliginosibacterium sp. H3]|uniref:Outer-membrane lipoprotein LolB n=1 Tax=Uliginosibacterium silvisoli TaxID=3114758 RepID=A0ABU6K454_9RHOO|nr:outer membrane lipoprotein LolB [Uliginosibacterium sp. H3]